MGIRLRIRHAAGTETADVLPTQPGKPLILGRAEECDVVLPSARVARRQVAFFVHQGCWMAKDLGKPTTVLLNDKPLAAPAAVKMGDTLSLTRETPPLMVKIVAIDPKATAAFRAPAAPAAPEPRLEDEPADLSDVVRRVAHRPAEQPSTWSGPLVGIVLVLLLFGAPLWYYWPDLKPWLTGQRQIVISVDAATADSAGTPLAERVVQAPLVSTPQLPATPADAPSDGEGSRLFSSAPLRAPAPRPAPAPLAAPSRLFATSPAEEPMVPSPVVDPVLSTAPDDHPDRQTPEWKRVMEAAGFSPPAERLYLFLQYRELHPQTPLLGELDQMQQVALDALYWQRVEGLAAVYATADPAGKAEVDRVLRTEMGFNGTPPPPGDAAALAAAKSARDPSLYQQWCELTLTRIQRSRGAMPW